MRKISKLGNYKPLPSMCRVFLVLVWRILSSTALRAQTPLLDAIETKNLPKVQQLVEAGADVNALDENGATPLMWTAYQADLEMVKWLVDNGADPFLKKGCIYLNREKTAYYGNLTGIAAGEGKLDILRYLIEKLGIDVDDREYNPETSKEDGWTAAQWADSRVHGDVMAYLEKSADISFLSDTLIGFNVDIKNGASFYVASAYKASTILFEKHIDTIKDMVGASDTTIYAKFLNSLANSCRLSGNHQVAEQYYSELSILWKSAVGDNYPEYANSLNNLAGLYESMGRYAEAEPLYTQLVEIRKAELGEDHPNYAQSLSDLADLYETIGRYTDAEPLYLKTLGIEKEQFGENHSYYAPSLSNLAVLYKRLGGYSEAEQFMLKTMGIFKARLGEHHPDYAQSLNNLALLSESMGRYSQAEPFMLNAMEIRKAQLDQDHPTYVSSLNNLTLLYENMDRYSEAEPLIRKVTEITKAQLGEDHPSYAISLNNLAGLYQSMGRYAGAEPLYKQALEIEKVQLGEDHPSYASSLNNLAVLYKSMGRYAEAEPLYTQALEIRKAQRGEDNPSSAISLNNLAELYRSMGRYTEAVSLHLETREFWKARLGENHPSYAITLNNLAMLYKDMGRYAETVPLYTQAMEIYKLQLGEYHPLYAQSLNNLAGQYKSIGRYVEAERLCSKAMGIYKAQLGEEHPDYAISLNNLACLYEGLGRYTGAEPLLLQAQQVYLHQLHTVFPTLSQKGKEQLLNTFNYYFEIFHSFAEKRWGSNSAITAHQYDNTLLLKGLLLQSSSQMRERIHASGDTTAIRLFVDWQAFKRQWLRESEIPKSEREKTGADPEATLAKANTLEKELSRRSEAFAEATDTPRTSWREVKRQLHPREVAIELIRYRWHNKHWTDTVHYAAIIVTPETDEHPIIVVLKNGEGVYGLQRAFQVAGAETVIFSLWKVADKQTQEMMGLFYQNWLQKDMTKLQAFKTAQQTIKDKYEDPYYWGPFVMIGG